MQLKHTGIQTLFHTREGRKGNKDRHKASQGYQAPECKVGGEPSEKSDVFSFGVVMLELLTGRLPIDTSRPKGQQSLLTWVSVPLSTVG